ncbi:putative O-methyltransferase [Hypoxylon sp. FL1284]|nr:putative O-methyltransferase [Hypoxylon sp. FL1284]
MCTPTHRSCIKKGKESCRNFFHVFEIFPFSSLDQAAYCIGIAFIMASNLGQSVSLIERLNDLTSRLSQEDSADARSEASKLSRQLTASLEQPENTAVNLIFSPFIPIAARLAVDLDLFRRILQHGPITSQELARQSGGEELLIIRILRPLASMGLIKEAGPRTWEATPITKVMASEEIAAGYRMVGEMIVGAATKAPKWFKETGYRCPTDPRDGIVQYAFQTKLTTFQLFVSMPDILRDFNAFMGKTMGARRYWVDWYPVKERLLDGATKESALLVDVGGGKGHDIIAFHNRFPDQGTLVLQDLAAVTASIIDIHPSIESMGYDFFSEQPVKGARVYFYHHILHDWSDPMCLEILAQVTKAMKPGYSKLLLHEMIIPEQGASTFHAMLDMTMMMFNAGMERTESQWKELLGKAGLEVIKVWPSLQQDADGIVEAILKE